MESLRVVAVLTAAAFVLCLGDDPYRYCEPLPEDCHVISQSNCSAPCYLGTLVEKYFCDNDTELVLSRNRQCCIGGCIPDEEPETTDSPPPPPPPSESEATTTSYYGCRHVWPRCEGPNAVQICNCTNIACDPNPFQCEFATGYCNCIDCNCKAPWLI